MSAIPQKRKREEMLLISGNTPISKHYSLCLNPCLKFSQNSMLRIMKSNTIWILTLNMNYRRKIPPQYELYWRIISAIVYTYSC